MTSVAVEGLVRLGSAPLSAPLLSSLLAWWTENMIEVRMVRCHRPDAVLMDVLRETHGLRQLLSGPLRCGVCRHSQVQGVLTRRKGRVMSGCRMELA